MKVPRMNIWKRRSWLNGNDMSSCRHREGQIRFLSSSSSPPLFFSLSVHSDLPLRLTLPLLSVQCCPHWFLFFISSDIGIFTSLCTNLSKAGAQLGRNTGGETNVVDTRRQPWVLIELHWCTHAYTQSVSTFRTRKITIKKVGASQLESHGNTHSE